MQEHEDKIEIQSDFEQANYKKPTTIKDNVMLQFHLCQKIGSKELCLGGERAILVKGEVRKVIVENTAEAYANAVSILYETLYPFIIVNKAFMKDGLEQIKTFKLKVSEYKKITRDKINGLKSQNKPKGAKQLEIDSVYKIDKLEYDLAKLIFRHLSVLLHKLNYMENKIVTAG